MYCQRKHVKPDPSWPRFWVSHAKTFNVDIMNVFKELKEIIFKELKEIMVLIKESLQGNENYKNLPYGNSQTEKFSNRIYIFIVRI